MIRMLRIALSVATVVLLFGGYLASMFASTQGTFASYAEKVDSAPIRTLALIVLVAAVGSCFLRGEENEA